MDWLKYILDSEARKHAFNGKIDCSNTSIESEECEPDENEEEDSEAKNERNG